MSPTTLRMIWERMRADRGLLFVVGLLSFVATTLLVLGPVSSDAIVEGALRQRLADADPNDAGVLVTGRVAVADIDAASEQIARLLPTPSTVLWLARSSSIRFEPSAADDDVVTTLLATDALDDLVSWRQGGAPGDNEAALHIAAAEELGLDIGDRIPTADGPGDLTLVGVFEPTDRTDPRWFGEPILRDGVVTGERFTSVGPIVVDPSTLAAFDDRASMIWRVLPTPDAVTLHDAPSLRSLPTIVRSSLEAGQLVEGARIESGLDVLLQDTDRALTATRAVVAALLAMVAALAVPALTIAGGLLVESRRVESALALSRGADRRQLLGAGLLESAVLVAAVAMLGIPAAIGSLWLIDRSGTAGRLSLDPVVTRWTLGALGLGVILSLIVIALPLRSLGTYTEARANQTRDDDPGWLRRTRFDLVGIVLALLGLWQIGTIARTPTERFEADPTVILAPALALAAGGLLALRTVRGIGLVGQALTASARGLTGPLVARTLARRPTNAARSAVLVLLAVAIGGFALVHRATWQASQRDQADAEVGVDIAATISQRSGRLPDELVAGAAQAIDGVTQVRAAVISEASTGDGAASVLLTDSTELGAMSTQRTDLGSPTVPFERLRSFEAATGLSIAGDRIEFDVATSGTTSRAEPQELGFALVVRDADGLVLTLPTVFVTIGTGDSIAVDFAVEADGGTLPYRTPLTILQIAVDAPAGYLSPDRDEDDIRSSVVAELSNWRLDGAPIDVEPALGSFPGDLAQAVSPTSLDVANNDDGHRFTINGGLSRSQNSRVHFRVPVGRAFGNASLLPVIVTPAVLADQAIGVGDHLDLRIGQTRWTALIVGTIPAVPAHPRDTHAIVADLATASMRALATDQSPPRPSHLLIRSDAASSERVMELLGDRPLLSPEVQSRWARAAELATDPVQLGVVVALMVALLAAGVAALAGLTANALHDRRSRVSDVAVLRALGASSGVLRRLIVFESVAVIGVAIGLGVTIAVALGHLVIGSLAVNADGLTALPEPIVVVPWAKLAVLAVVASAATVALPLLVSASLRRQSTADVLRSGEGRQ